MVSNHPSINFSELRPSDNELMLAEFEELLKHGPYAVMKRSAVTHLMGLLDNVDSVHGNSNLAKMRATQIFEHLFDHGLNSACTLKMLTAIMKGLKFQLMMSRTHVENSEWHFHVQ